MKRLLTAPLLSTLLQPLATPPRTLLLRPPTLRLLPAPLPTPRLLKPSKLFKLQASNRIGRVDFGPRALFFASASCRSATDPPRMLAASDFV